MKHTPPPLAWATLLLTWLLASGDGGVVDTLPPPAKDYFLGMRLNTGRPAQHRCRGFLKKGVPHRPNQKTGIFYTKKRYQNEPQKA